MSYTRNSDLNFYEDHRHDTNCGSFALRVNEWYRLDDNFEDHIAEDMDLEEWIRYGIFELNLSDYEMSNHFAAVLKRQILQDFDDIRVLEKDDFELENNEELIAFRTFIWWDSYCGCADWDFHFMVLRDGEWQEKMGNKPVSFCENTEIGWGDYISDTIYFAKKI